MSNTRPQYKPFLKGGPTGREITLLNQSLGNIALVSTVHRTEALTLQDTIYGSCHTETVRPGDSGRVTLAEGQTAVYAWFTRNNKGPIPQDAYPDAAAIFNAEGQLVHEIHDRTALRFQKTSTLGLFWIVTPQYITVKNGSDQPLWYQTSFTTDSTVSRQNGKFNSPTARKLEGNTETNFLLLGDCCNTLFYTWLGSNGNLPVAGTVSDMGVLVQNSNGAVIAAEVDAAIVFEVTGTSWTITTVNSNGTSNGSVPSWVWIVLVVVIGILILVALYHFMSHSGKSTTTETLQYKY